MSYDFHNQSLAITRTLSGQSWAKMLELACLYGWEPRGTYPPSPDLFLALNVDWHGGYLTNDGQIVTAEDALSLAKALEKTLNDIPDENIRIDWNAEFWREDDLPEWLSPEEKQIIQDGLEAEGFDIIGIHPFEFFRGDQKDSLVSFIKLCRLGSFRIS